MAVRVPGPLGINVTLIVQEPPAASVLPQVLADTEKSEALVPVITTLVMFKVALPVLLSMTLRGGLDVDMDWVPEVRLFVERLATGALPTPVPVRVINCGLPAALSKMATEALRLPADAGVKVTLIVQLLSAATEAPQLLVTVKSLALAPVAAIPAMFNAALPVLFRVTDCAALVVPRFWLGKVRVLVVRLTVGLEPVPVRVTICGPPAALSEMVTAAVRLPTAVGVKITLIVQLPCAASELPQVEVSGKSATLAPVTVMLVKVRVALPLLVTVTVWAGALVPSNWLPKVRMPAERPTPPERPVPVRFTVCGLPAALSVNTTEAVRVPAALGVNVTLRVH